MASRGRNLRAEPGVSNYIVSMRNSLAVLGLAVAFPLSGCAKAVVIPEPVTVSSLIPDAEEPREAHVTLHMDVAFTPDERKDAFQATEVWRKQTNDLARITLLYDLDFDDMFGLNELFTHGASLVVRRDSQDALVKASDEEAGCDDCVLGWMNSGGLHAVGHPPVHGAFIWDRLEGHNAEVVQGIRLQVMIHEFGHVLGLPHVGASQAIMYPSVAAGKGRSCLTKADLVAFCSVNECGTTRLYPCE